MRITEDDAPNFNEPLGKPATHAELAASFTGRSRRADEGWVEGSLLYWRERVAHLEDENNKLRAALKFELDAKVSTIMILTAGMPPERVAYFLRSAPKIKRLKRVLGIPDDDDE